MQLGINGGFTTPPQEMPFEVYKLKSSSLRGNVGFACGSRKGCLVAVCASFTGAVLPGLRSRIARDGDVSSIRLSS
jgi:hypothetical protein